MTTDTLPRDFRPVDSTASFPLPPPSLSSTSTPRQGLPVFLLYNRVVLRLPAALAPLVTRTSPKSPCNMTIRSRLECPHGVSALLPSLAFATFVSRFTSALLVRRLMLPFRESFHPSSRASHRAPTG
jgi:hypothetical protein